MATLQKDEIEQRVQQGVRALLDDGRWRSFLQLVSKFHRYSCNNVMLIFSQRPDATFVKGFHAWRSLGRYVKKGERAIQIVAPLIKRETAREEASELTRVVGFRWMSVFDITQTSGEPLRGLPRALQTAASPQLLATVYQAIPFPVETVPDLNGANGVFSVARQSIRLVDHLAPDMQVKTLLHEWAHGLRLAHDIRSRAQEEVVAEATACVVADHYGLDTRAYSVGYVASWSEGNASHVLEATDEILRRSQHIIGRMQEIERAAIRSFVHEEERHFPER